MGSFFSGRRRRLLKIIAYIRVWSAMRAVLSRRWVFLISTSSRRSQLTFHVSGGARCHERLDSRLDSNDVRQCYLRLNQACKVPRFAQCPARGSGSLLRSACHFGISRSDRNPAFSAIKKSLVGQPLQMPNDRVSLTFTRVGVAKRPRDSAGFKRGDWNVGEPKRAFGPRLRG
jgi:hypothetical protein